MRGDGSIPSGYRPIRFRKRRNRGMAECRFALYNERWDIEGWGDLMNLQYIDEFVHLARTLNFTQTANEMHVTQPTLSKHMAMLETDLKTKLFDRTSSGVHLTEEGHYFIGPAATIVEQYTTAKRNIAESKKHRPIFVDGRFEDRYIVSVLSLAVLLMKEQGEDNPVVFNHNKEESAVNLLLEKKIDVVIDLEPQTLEDTSPLMYEPALSRPFVAIMETSNPLSKQSSVSIDDLRDETLVHLVCEDLAPGWNSVHNLCLQHGFEPKARSVSVSSQAESLVSIPSGCVLIYPRSDSELDVLERIGQWSYVPLDDADAAFNLYLSYRRDNAERVAPFIEALDQASERMKE
jgi:DNA-binding transcriptional LysR family regulator